MARPPDVLCHSGFPGISGRALMDAGISRQGGTGMSMSGQFQPQYSPTPQFQGADGMPPAVRRAVMLMRVGALIKGIEVVVSLTLNSAGLSTLSVAWLGGALGV